MTNTASSFDNADPGLHRRRGIALMVVIVAMTVVAGLAAGAFWLSVNERRMGDSTRRMHKSFGVAELGLNETMRTWNSLSNTIGLYPKDSLIIPVTATASKTGAYNGRVYKLSETLMLVEMNGMDTLSRSGRIPNGSRQRLGMLLRINPQRMTVKAALTAPGDKVKIENETLINGNDSIPPKWSDCPPKTAATAGVRSDSGTSVKVKAPAIVIGNPALYADPAFTATSPLYAMGGLNVDSLIANADIVSAGGVNWNPKPEEKNGLCDTSIPTNWGDPLNPDKPCGSYFPIIYVKDDIQIDNGMGQGILIVEDRLTIMGTFKWTGIIIAFGPMKLGNAASNGDPEILGAVVSLSRVDLKSKADTIQRTHINYSSCAVQRALHRTSNVSMLRSRSWVQLY